MTYAMSNLLYIANAVSTGELVIEGSVRIEVERQEVCAYLPDNRSVLDYVYLDSERLGQDNYTFELTPAEYSTEEVEAYMATSYAAELTAYNLARRNAVKRIAELTSGVTADMQEIINLATQYDVPADIKINGRTNDFRLIDSVDWDSSSMYC